MNETSNSSQAALDYHRYPTPEKISITSTKPTDTQDDLSLCYTPGVAVPVREIAKNPLAAYDYTAKGNLVGVITDGSAILGLGNLGALASKPVMEGKAVLFKLLADIDVFDIEVTCQNSEQFIDTVANIAPTFGGINLEDIKAPECFAIEEVLRARLNIPVFHDDQHGTAIVVAAGLLNALEIQQKTLADARIAFAGAGAAGFAIAKLLLELGARPEHILMVDRQGVIHLDRTDLNEYKRQFAISTSKRALIDAVHDADVFVGVSGPGILTPDMLTKMASRPIVFALSNPVPEIMPEIAKSIRPDVLMATGRSDYPNQVNNALCFPFVFRGALDVRATCINEAMKLAAVHAIRELAHEPISEDVLSAYGLTQLAFGPDYILPKLLDKRLKLNVSSAVARAAIDSGVTPKRG